MCRNKRKQVLYAYMYASFIKGYASCLHVNTYISFHFGLPVPGVATEPVLNQNRHYLAEFRQLSTQTQKALCVDARQDYGILRFLDTSVD